MSASFRRLAKIDAQILRGAAVVNGKRADAGTVIATLKITPFTSASSEVVQRTVTEAPTKLLTTYCEGPLTVQEGDELATGGLEYPIKGCSRYDGFGDSNTFELTVEDVRA